MSDTENPPSSYCCPGENQPISRAVHLGRLSAFYPPCRRCPHRNDAGTLSPRQVEQLEEVRLRTQPRPLFHDEGVCGVYLNELTPAVARQIAAAFGAMLQISNSPNLQIQNLESHPNPTVVLAGDGRPITAELSAAVGEGLRLSGCNVIDIGPASAACLAFALCHPEKMGAGGILVGNPGRQPHQVGLQFWLAGPRPLSAGGSLEPLADLYQAGMTYPRRHYGKLQRAQADIRYLAALAEHYHALRPLRILIDSASGPVLEYLQKLAASVACRVIPARAAEHELPGQVRADAAHFAASIDGDGEICNVFDELGRAVPTERLLLLLARETLSDAPVIVLENSTSSGVVQAIEKLGARAALSNARRAEMAAAMHEQGAVFGGGPSGRFWHRTANAPLPDALMTITRLLAILSRSDESLSAVLDRENVPG